MAFLHVAGQVFEEDNPRTLTEEMAAVKKWFDEQGIEVSGRKRSDVGDKITLKEDCHVPAGEDRRND